MRELGSDIACWFDEGVRVAQATVVRTWGSSPRPAGSLMAVDERGRVCGSVSGGCIEGVVVRAALDCLDTGCPRVEQFHASMESAHDVGLSCGGSVEVHVAPLNASMFGVERSLIASDESYLKVIVLEGVPCEDSMFVVLSEQALTHVEEAASVVRIRLAAEWCAVVPCCLVDSMGESAIVSLADAAMRASAGASAGEVTDGAFVAFFSRSDPPPQIVCVGGAHVSIHLARMAHLLGYRTVVVDPRRMFASEDRFPFVDELVQEWPQEAFRHIKLTSATAVCALTHDPKIDVPALAAALDSSAFYIGSLGKHTTQLARLRALQEEGYTADQIGRIFGPIGLDIGGKDPSEIALSILGEITAVKNFKNTRAATMVASAGRAVAEEVARATRPADEVARAVRLVEGECLAQVETPPQVASASKSALVARVAGAEK